MNQGGRLEPLDAHVDQELAGRVDQAPPERRRRGRIVLRCTLTAVIAGAVAVVVLRNPARTPEQDLARVRDFVTAAATGRFEGTSRSEYGSGGDAPGSTSIDISSVEGSFDVPDRVHALDESGDYATETITLRTGTYVRDAETKAGLHDEPWVYYEATEESTIWEATGPAAGAISPAGLNGASGVLGALGAPFDLSELLGRLGDDVRRVSPGELEATVRLRDLLSADIVDEIERSMAEMKAQADAEAATDDSRLEEDVDLELSSDFDTGFLDDPVVFRLLHASDGRLDELTVTIESGEGDDRSVERDALTFTDWGEPVRIDAPDPSQIDDTPGIDEEELASFAAFPVLAPRSLPDGFLLRTATTEPMHETEGCEYADLEYGPGPADDGDDVRAEDGRPPFLDLQLRAASCDSENRVRYYGADEGPTEAVDVAGHPAQLGQSDDFGFGDARQTLLHVGFTVGATAIDAYSNLPRERLLATLATLGPLDLAAQPIDRLPPPPGN
jgi:hypothetical protein